MALTVFVLAQIQAQTAKDGTQTLLGAMSGQLNCHSMSHEAQQPAATNSSAKGAVVEPSQPQDRAQPFSGSSQCQQHQPQEAPQRPAEDTTRSESSRRPAAASTSGPGPRCLRGVWIVPDAPPTPNRNEADHEAAVW